MGKGRHGHCVQEALSPASVEHLAVFLRHRAQGADDIRRDQEHQRGDDASGDRNPQRGVPGVNENGDADGRGSGNDPRMGEPLRLSA